MHNTIINTHSNHHHSLTHTHLTNTASQQPVRAPPMRSHRIRSVQSQPQPPTATTNHQPLRHPNPIHIHTITIKLTPKKRTPVQSTTQTTTQLRNSHHRPTQQRRRILRPAKKPLMPTITNSNQLQPTLHQRNQRPQTHPPTRIPPHTTAQSLHSQQAQHHTPHPTNKITRHTNRTNTRSTTDHHHTTNYQTPEASTHTTSNQPRQLLNSKLPNQRQSSQTPRKPQPPRRLVHTTTKPTTTAHEASP